MKYILIVLVLDGFILGFYSTYSTNLIPSNISDKINTGVFLSIAGLGAIFGGYFSGSLSDKYQVVVIGKSAVVFTTLTLILSFFCVYSEPENLVLPFVCAFFWGYLLYFLEGWISVACAKLFNGDLESFAIQKQLHSLSFIFYQIYFIISDGKITIYYSFYIIMLLSIISYFSLIKLSK
jgi:predicted MFS family arabinose efflux permease